MISKATSAPWLPDPHILSVGDIVHTMVFEDEGLKLSIIGWQKKTFFNVLVAKVFEIKNEMYIWIVHMNNFLKNF